MSRSTCALLVLSLALGLWSCVANQSKAPVQWAIAIHGGAGTIAREAPAEQLAEHKAALEIALRHGQTMLANGASAMDVCEAVVRILEDNPHFNAGKGAVFNEKGEHELDASIMDGATLSCGAVAGVRTVKNPVSLARLVMQRTKHVLLMGEGAEQFATLMGVERVPNTWFDTEHRRKVLEEVLRERAAGLAKSVHTYGTVGCVVRDAQGHLAAATSTGGLTGKRWGRVGDTPIIGAGNWADARVAVSGTGTGEQFIRHAVARTIAARMEYGGQSLQEATDGLVQHTLQPDDGGVIAVDRDGRIAMPYNSEGMYRGAADSTGRFEVHIHEE